MAAPGGLVSIRVLTRSRLETFLEMKNQHIVDLIKRSLSNGYWNKRHISYVFNIHRIGTNQCTLKTATSRQQVLPHCISCCHYHHSSMTSPPSLAGGHKNCSNKLPIKHIPLSFTSTRHFHCTSVHHSPSQKDPLTSEAPSDPFKLVAAEMANLSHDIRAELNTNEPLLKTMSHYYFDGKGKSFRPLVALLMSKACNIHSSNTDGILWPQKVVAMVAEMIHTASLVHDDVIDCSDTRRGQSSLNRLHGQRQSILTGDYILSQASIALAGIGNTNVICILSSILEDLVNGEFMQLGSKEDENERFAHYLQKTYKKTASLIANTCKSAAILSGCDEDVAESAFQYGRNLGIAFQLVDDLLDFTSCESDIGKPTAADLKLGLATAPVLFAAQEHPQLHPLIMRRFSEPGDVEYARQLVAKSDGVEQTRILAAQHSKEAIRNIAAITESSAQKGLIQLARLLLDRKK